MNLLLMRRTPAIERALDELSRVQVSESGKDVGLRASHPANEQEFSHELENHPLVLSDTITTATAHMLRRQPGAGVLVLSATTGLDAHGTLRGLLRDRTLDARHVALFGTRVWTREESDFVRANRVQAYSMLELSREGLGEMTDAVMSYVRNWSAFHLIIDLSVVDPAFAPGLVSASPGGLSSRELIYALQRLALIKTLASVEVIVDADDNPVTAKLVAHILAELS